MKNRLAFNRPRRLSHFLQFAALATVATSAAAQSYQVIDLGTLGPNSRGNYSIA